MTQAPPPMETLDVEEIAAAWFARERVGMSEAEAAEFAVWLDRDPDNRAAYELLDHAWYGVEAMRHDPRVLAMREEALKARRDPWRKLYAPAIAASLLLTVAGGAWVASRYDAWFGGRFPTQSFRTGVGEKATVTLPDGSTLTLDTNTVVRTKADRDRRLIYLDKGQAFFRVAHDPSRPFIVAAAGRTVTAVGTAFDVRVDAKRFEVTLVEGKVRVEAPAPPAPGHPPRTQAVEMVAGAQLTARGDRDWSLRETDVRRETSWVRGQLVFSSEPLSEVVAELNRYTDRKIVVADPAIAGVRFSGTFKPGDVEGFVTAVQDYKFARIERQDPASIRLVAF